MSRSKVQFNSPVILTFSLISFIVLIVNYVVPTDINRLFFSVYRSSLIDPLTYVRLIGHVFGHAGSTHFLSNIMLILVIGPLLEEKYGSYNILFVIIATALITGLVHIAFFPYVRLLGASGIVFAFIMLSSFSSMREGRIPLTFILVAIIYIGGEIFNALFVTDNISNLTHILGGLVGAWLGYVMNTVGVKKY